MPTHTFTIGGPQLRYVKRTRIVRGVTTALAIAGFATLADSAAAAEYRVYSCGVPDTARVSISPWESFESSEAGANHDDNCSNPAATSGHPGVAVVNYNAWTPVDAVAGFHFARPDGLLIRSIDWQGETTYRTDYSDNSTPSWRTEVDTDAGKPFSTRGVLAWDTRRIAVPTGARYVRLQLRCDAGGGCISRDHRIVIRELRVLLADEHAPAADRIAGSLSTAGYKRAGANVLLTTSDVGSGVYRSRLVVDGVASNWHVPDANGGACAPLVASDRAFRTAVPCRTTVSDSWSFDSTTVPDGSHDVAVRVEDAAGNERTVWSKSVRVNNPGGSVPDTACTDGLDNDGDGRVDRGDDPGCTSEADAAETEDPTSVSAPRISGVARVGNSFGAEAGTWNDGPGSGGASTRRWQACRYDGEACVDVPDAAGWVLAIGDGLIGRRVRIVETRVTSEGTATRASAVSDVVTAPDGSLPVCADGKDNDGDNAIDYDADRGCSSRSDTTEDLSGPDEDPDGDGIPNRDDTDDDGDGVRDGQDPKPLDPSTPSTDWDGDGIPNASDPDDDNDGVADDKDPFPYNPLLPTKEDPSGDWDGDGIPNDRDPDDDNDSVPDTDDPAPRNPLLPGTSGSSGPGTTIIIERGGSTSENHSTTSTLVLGPATNGTGATNKATVSLVGRRAMTVGHGRRFAAVGRLVNEYGQPIAGAVLTIESIPFVPKSGPMKGATYRTITPAQPVVTDRDGRFRWLAPAGSSRVIRFGYRARGTDRDFTAVDELTVSVYSKATLNPSRRVLRNGQTVRFSGKLLGGQVPATGVQVVLQARTARGWMTFKTVRTNRKGAYSASYRFVSTTGTRTYTFRARVQADSGYPWLPSTSRSTKVTVRGR